MPVSNAQIADIFFRMVELLELEGEDRFRARAFRRAAIMIANLRRPLAEMISAGEDLEDLPGIGPDLAARIREICRTGRMKALDKLQARIPKDIVALSALPGIGPKRLRLLREQLGIDSLADLQDAAAAGRVRTLPRFGKRLEDQVLEAARGAAGAVAGRQST